MKKTLISMAAVALSSLTSLAQAQTVLTVSSWVPPTHGLTVTQKRMVRCTVYGRHCNRWHLRHLVGFPGLELVVAIHDGLSQVLLGMSTTRCATGISIPLSRSVFRIARLMSDLSLSGPMAGSSNQ